MCARVHACMRVCMRVLYLYMYGVPGCECVMHMCMCGCVRVRALLSELFVFVVFFFQTDFVFLSPLQFHLIFVPKSKQKHYLQN